MMQNLVAKILITTHMNLVTTFFQLPKEFDGHKFGSSNISIAIVFDGQLSISMFLVATF
jgi:hypothetical protein